MRILNKGQQLLRLFCSNDHQESLTSNAYKASVGPSMSSRFIMQKKGMLIREALIQNERIYPETFFEI
jgi:Ribonuclease G/E